jgi:hypothetical protein
VGQLALAVGGAVIGSFFGMPQLGFVLGSLAGSLLFPVKGPNIQGSRLGDLKVSSSSYGTSIPIIHGTMRVSGNIIWAPDFKEVRNVQKAGGKGGGGGTTTTYTYFGSFAIGLCEGVAGGVRRIWLDSKLVYDVTGSGDTLTTVKGGFNFKFYRGTETQLPDGRMEQDLGVGNVPAHRGLCYMVVRNLNLTEFGNRLPNVSVELAMTAEAEPSFKPWTRLPDPQSFSNSRLVMDYNRSAAYYLLGSGSNTRIGRFNWQTMQEDRIVDGTVTYTDFTVEPNVELEGNYSVLHIGGDGFLYAVVNGASNRSVIVRISPDTLRPVAIFGRRFNAFPNDPYVTDPEGSNTNYTNAVRAFEAITVNAASGPVVFVVTGSWSFNPAMLQVYTSDLEVISSEFLSNNDITSLAAGEAGLQYSIWYATESSVSNAVTSGNLHKRVQFDPALSSVEITALGLPGPETFEFAAADFNPEASHFAFHICAYDPTDDSLLCAVACRSSASGTIISRHIVKISSEGEITWNTLVASIPLYTPPRSNRIRQGSFSYRVAQTIYTIDTNDGTLETNNTWGTVHSSTSGGWFFDDVTRTLTLQTSTHGWVRQNLGRILAETANVAEIVRDVCHRTGLESADIDVTDLASLEVGGHYISRQVPARVTLQTLASAFFFDGIESDHVLKFKTRGTDPVAQLTEGSLRRIDNTSGVVVGEERIQDVDLPSAVTVLYMDRDKEYTQGSQTTQRVALPAPTMYSRNAVALELPMALTAEHARQTADVLLYNAWLERSSVKCTSDWRWLRLDPADVVDLVLDSGASFRLRLTKADIGADLAYELSGLTEDSGVYNSPITSEGGLGVPQQLIRTAGPTKLFMFNTPLLRDVDDTARARAVVYYSMTTYNEQPWSAGFLFRSTDDLSYMMVGFDDTPIAWGSMVDALPDVGDYPFHTDYETMPRVYMSQGSAELESRPYEDVLGGANAALVIKANGDTEVIQFLDAVEQPDGSYRLGGLFRGRRGTDVFANGHAPNETFILLSIDAVDKLEQSVSEVGSARFYRSVGVDSALEEADTIAHPNRGLDLKPYAPWDVQAELSGSDIELSWIRRTRVNGGLHDDLGEVPLNEDFEAYEIDVLDGTDGEVLRTLMSDEPSVTYLEADILTDFGSTPTELNVVVYQMSAQIGRGFGRSATLEL